MKMNDIDTMKTIVVSEMYTRGIHITDIIWLNFNRSPLIKTKEHGSFLLKHSQQWLLAGSTVPALGKGAGMTLNLDTYNELIEEKPTIMFAMPESEHIYYQTWDEFTRLSEEHIQEFNKEPVRVILTKSLKRW